MVGANLSSMGSPQIGVSRPGFPYSCFIERVGEGREHWFGPFEDDITHAFQYGTSAESGTALVCPMVQYAKESTSKSGMRSRYNHERSVNLHRIFPESAKVVAMATKSDGRKESGGRVFHKMRNGAIRNPQVITDRELYGQIRERLQGLFNEYLAMRKEHNRQKVQKRAR